ncbi:hypothetical protein K2173_025079 [Erythroxylum novogranatense]|uniref:Uncharacterized protein n=1 Tax=Erythroxylum novogranatense TaxID=1862640 RepID=A0AAV8SVE3_9ROSI|nr:hypothetical protein K2173_025079 [Erythroxylum novogranatense]
MNNRRRQWAGDAHRHVQRTGSQFTKPPQGSWQPTVPAWEKKFCYLVGSIPWNKLLETKRSMYLYENVVKWDDSAGEEAFQNAKSRFWAEINGLPCNISLPDPDIYIDEIDWNANVDPDLLLDLELEPKAPDEREKGEEVVILGSSLFLNQPFSCTGWGDFKDDMQKAAEGYGECNQNIGNNWNSWDSNTGQTNGGFKDNNLENCWNNSKGWEDNCNEWNKSSSGLNNVNSRAKGSGGMMDGYGKKRDVGHCYMSQYKVSKFHGDDYQIDRGWRRNGRGRKKVNFVH